MPQVELNGVKQLRKAIRLFAPDLNKELNKELRKALKPVVTQARGFVPSDSPISQWQSKSFSSATFPMYNAFTIRAGIGFTTSAGRTTKSGFTSNASIFNSSPAGAIYETAGRKNPSGQPWVGAKAGGSSRKVSHSTNPNAGKTFISKLPPLVQSNAGAGRLIFRAWANNKGVAYGAALKAIDIATRAFNERAKTSTFSKVIK